ncbi:MAG: ribosome assembly RNA-binding protein YhbY [Gammaproteobacteria bacterium]|nr:ribosome assembly RNA-binding protein YhbY [Gammaproteobacteria bacterium]
MQALTSSQVRHLRGLAHKLKPVVSVGQAGASEAVALELDAALEHHELLKVKIHTGERDVMHQIAAALAQRTGAQVVQTIGRVVVMYRAAQKPRLILS